MKTTHNIYTPEATAAAALLSSGVPKIGDDHPDDPTMCCVHQHVAGDYVRGQGWYIIEATYDRVEPKPIPKQSRTRKGRQPKGDA